MAIITGTLTPNSLIDDRVNEVKSLIIQHLSDFCTFFSDTGTGNNRIIIFKVPDSGHDIIITRNNNEAHLGITKYGTSTNLRAISTGNRNVGDSFKFIINSNSALLIFGSDIALSIMLSRTGGILKFVFHSVTTSGNGLNHHYDDQSDVALKELSWGQIVINRILQNGKSLFFPLYCAGPDNVALLNEPLSDIFTVYPAHSNLTTIMADGISYVCVISYQNMSIVFRINP